MGFTVTVLGSNSSIPAPDRNSSSHLVKMNGRLFLVDCAEATQIQLRKFHVKLQSIEAVFISHLHGDHYFGIMGLISTLHLLGRTKDLHVFAPPELKNIIETHHNATNKILHFPLIFHKLDEDTDPILFEDKKLIVRTFPLNHSVPSFGFVFKTKEKERKFRKEILTKMDIHYTDIQRIKKGDDYVDNDGKVFKNDDLTVDPEPSVSYAYCSDTAYSEDIIQYIKGVDLLYHEATFLEDNKSLAAETLHSTAKEAAMIALKAGAGKLLIGHFSPRYEDINGFLREAREIFPETYLADDGDEYVIQ